MRIRLPFTLLILILVSNISLFANWEDDIPYKVFNSSVDIKGYVGMICETKISLGYQNDFFTATSLNNQVAIENNEIAKFTFFVLTNNFDASIVGGLYGDPLLSTDNIELDYTIKNPEQTWTYNSGDGQMSNLVFSNSYEDTSRNGKIYYEQFSVQLDTDENTVSGSYNGTIKLTISQL